MPRLLPLCLSALLLLPGAVVWGRDFLFAGYNIENYAPVAVEGATKSGRPLKSAKAAEAVAQVVRELSPDILGVCEMGARVQFDEFRARMEAAGMGYVDAEWVDGPDPDRHLALFSRFPIVARQSVVDLPIAESRDIRQKVRRGFLDVTVEPEPGFRVRIVGVHLKSKLATPEGSAEVERRQEAHLLRLYVEAILSANPETNLLVFGDLNDTKGQPALQEITGTRGSASALAELRLADGVGDRWTHYWKAEDLYSRIDYLFVSRALAPAVVSKDSGVYRTPNWNQASDHRPVFATFHPPATP